MDNSAESANPEEEYSRRSKIFTAYTAFVTTLLIATIAKRADYPRAYILSGLLAVSLPSLVALQFLDFIVLVQQTRRRSRFRGLAVWLGFGPSIAGFATLIGHFSVIAAVLRCRHELHEL